jgi:GAF domain-containing protein
LSIYRQEVLPFTDKQIELLQNFAAQAVIAIENARLLNELRESLEQQTATSEVLQVISRSPGELQPVFETMLEKAVRICDARFGTLVIHEDVVFREVAQYNPPRDFANARPINSVFRPPPGGTLARIVETRQPVHFEDISVLLQRAKQDKKAMPLVELIELAGARTMLGVPMLKENELIGVIGIYRQEVRPFTDKQLALVQNFAAQAVIAIENTRLLNELRQRTTDLSESLEQQEATSEVLRVISSSPGDLEPVFRAMLANATRMCGASFGHMFRYEDGAFHTMATHNEPAGFEEFLRRGPIEPAPGTALAQILRDPRPVHVLDGRQIQTYSDGNPLSVAAAELGGVRTLLVVPMLKDDVLIGTLGIYRQEVRPFTDKQIALVQNFASQAVIAIENSRLLNELRQRTTDLSESLEQQTATSEVLRVISSSPGELEPVFKAMLENAARLCGATYGALFLADGDGFRHVAAHNAPPELIEERRRIPVIRPGPGTSLGRVAATKRPAQIADIRAEPAYTDDPGRLAIIKAGARTMLSVPMLKDNDLVGQITIYRQETKLFNDKQIALLQNFADQAVIAIENARLLNELRESLQQQTATADVLRVISSSPGELEPVFQAMLQNAVRLCDARFGNIYRCDGDTLNLVASHNTPPALFEARRSSSLRPDPQTPTGRIVTTKTLVHIADLTAEQAYADDRKPAVVEAVELGGIRTLLLVPMLKNDELVGVLTIYRQEVRPFTDKQIGLMQNFAAQAVIAIENTRLLNDLNKLNQQLEQRVTDQVDEIERMGRLRRFLPPQVADLIVASGTEKQLESHRREITALFCDLRGFTGFSESSDPEDVMSLLREYHTAIGEIIVKYSGTLERYAGDGVMVVFNDPVPVENPALQAVLMALDMRTAIGAMVEKWRLLGHDLGFGIGIAHGFATLGTIGFEGRFDYAAIGTVSNVASRLCDEAKPGQILISPRVMLAVDKTITVELVGEFNLKGIRRPMAAYNVLAPSISKPN